MTDLDRDIFLELIREYNIDELQKELDNYRELSQYIAETKKTYAINEKTRRFIYNEENNTQIFTNERTSIFFLNEKILNFEKLKLDPKIFVSQMSIVKPEELQKHLDTSKRYFGNAYSEVKGTNDRGIISEEDFFSINEYKLIRLLLKNPKLYTSCNNSVLHAKGENGYAYVLGKRNNQQLLLR